MEHIAIDLGSRTSQICVRDAQGQIVEERAYTTRHLGAYLRRRPAGQVIVEASSEAFGVARMAQAAGHQISVVPSVLSRALGVGYRGIKTDVRDARALSEALDPRDAAERPHSERAVGALACHEHESSGAGPYPHAAHQSGARLSSHAAPHAGARHQQKRCPRRCGVRWNRAKTDCRATSRRCF